MGDGIHRTIVAVDQFGTALARVDHAHREASRVLGMTEPVARRESKVLYRSLDTGVWRTTVSKLDQIATHESSRRADMAARLAEYTKSL